MGERSYAAKEGRDIASFLEAVDELDLSRYSVIGNYLRYEENARNVLKDLRQKVIVAFESPTSKHENYLVWAPPGSGKTSFVKQVASALKSVTFLEANMSEISEDGFRSLVSKASKSVSPTLVFLDEIDAREKESWPFESLLHSLEVEARGARHVYILAGSSGLTISEMKKRIALRPKGNDVLSRIPLGNEYSIPAMTEQDRVLVFLSSLDDATSGLGKRVNEVEKLGLYFVANHPPLGNARKLHEFALRCAERTPSGDERLKYDSMFEAGDPANKEFWVKNSPNVPKLVNSFLRFKPLEGAPRRMIEPVRAVAGVQSPKDRVAVLPFANTSPDAGDEYFADGLTEELISAVSRTKGLRVIARTSVMRYKGTTKPISEIGGELNVGSVLEGSVRKAGNKIRIAVQLVETANEEPRWSEQYDREIRDVFAIQSDIAEKVVRALRNSVLGLASAGGEKGATENAEAYESYLRGRESWNKRTEEGLRKAISFFEEALSLDGNYAKALTGLADSYATLALLEVMPPKEAYPKAKEAVGRALEIEPQLPEALTSLGLIRFQYDWDWKGAEDAFREASRINPSYAPAHHYFADLLKAMGRFDEALAEIGRAQELDPLSLAINTGVGHVLYLSRQYDKAIEQYRRAVELDPSVMATHVWFGRPYLEKKMYSEAISELETAVKLSGESTLAVAMLGHGLASAGNSDEANRLLRKLKERSLSQYVPSYWIAVIYNGFRDKKEVVRWMRKAFDERSSWLVWANVEPRFDWIRDDPEFSAIMHAMRFPRIV